MQIIYRTIVGQILFCLLLSTHGLFSQAYELNSFPIIHEIYEVPASTINNGQPLIIPLAFPSNMSSWYYNLTCSKTLKEAEYKKSKFNLYDIFNEELNNNPNPYLDIDHLFVDFPKGKGKCVMTVLDSSKQALDHPLGKPKNIKRIYSRAKYLDKNLYHLKLENPDPSATVFVSVQIIAITKTKIPIGIQYPLSEVTKNHLVGKWKDENSLFHLRKDGYLYINWDENDIKSTGTWKLKGEKFILQFEGFQDVYDLLFVADNKFIFKHTKEPFTQFTAIRLRDRK